MDEKVLACLRAIGMDVEATVERFGGNEALVLKYIRRFPQEPTISALQEAAMMGDREQVKLSAHTLKGVCGNLGITHAYEACVKLMATLRASDDSNYVDDYMQVMAACEQAIEQIKTLE